MNATLLLMMFYAGKSPHDTDVQMRAPIDIFSALKELNTLHMSIDELLKCIKDAPVGVATDGERINAWLHKRAEILKDMS